MPVRLGRPLVKLFVGRQRVAYGYLGRHLVYTPGSRVLLNFGHYDFTGKTVGSIRVMSLDKGSYTLSGKAMTAQSTNVVQLDKGSYTITGKGLTKEFNRGLAKGSYAITGKTLDTSATTHFDLDTGSYAITGKTLTAIPSGTSIQAAVSGEFIDTQSASSKQAALPGVFYGGT